MVDFTEMKEGGEVVKAKSVKQADLTAECWNVQVWGLEHCKTCEWKDSEECGGSTIRKTSKNEKGLKVPIG